MVSIIVPVYNVEFYLPRCIDSVLNQEYQDFELILVDDGSKDSSPQICDQYGRKDNRIRVIHKENGGVSSARNMGIRKAKGQYVFFLDSDDWILPGCINHLIKEALNYDADLCAGGRQTVSDTETTFKYNEKTGILEGQDKLDWIQDKIGYSYADMKRWLKEDNFSRGTVVWGRLYKRSLLTENSIYFDRKVKIAEDLLFDVKAAMLADVVVLTDKAEYCYFQREDSAIHQYLAGGYSKLVDNKVQLAYRRESLNAEFMQKGYPDISYMYQGSLVLSCAEIAVALGKNREMKYRDKLREYRRYAECAPVKKARKGLGLNDLSIKNAAALWLIKHNWYPILIILTGVVYK